MHTIGRHLLAEYYDCDGAILDDVDAIAKVTREATASIEATIVGETFHRFSPQGVSASILIAESHLSLHTWPEAGYAAADIYTCGDLDPRPGFELLGLRLGAKSSRMHEIIRGLPEDIESPDLKFPDDVQLVTKIAPVKPVSTAD